MKIRLLVAALLAIAAALAPTNIALAQVSGLPQSALGWYNRGYTTNRPYTIDPGSGPITVDCLMTLSDGGWTELTAAVADSALNTNTNTYREYLYVQNTTSLYYRTPMTNLVWSWNSGQDLYGTYYYSAGGGESSFEVTPSDEHESYGVGGSSGPGGTYKCLVIYPTCLDSSNARVELCQDQPGIFGYACQCGVTVYFRENTSSQLSAPVVTVPPTNVVISSGETAQFSVAAAGTPPLSYQWQFDGVAIAGGTNALLTITSAAGANAGVYSVIVSNSAGSVASSNAVLTLMDQKMYAVLTLAGQAGAVFGIQAIAALGGTNWVTVTNITLNGEPFLYIDYNSPTNATRFYRVVSTP